MGFKLRWLFIGMNAQAVIFMTISVIKSGDLSAWIAAIWCFGLCIWLWNEDKKEQALIDEYLAEAAQKLKD